jgi:hypothetical protein
MRAQLIFCLMAVYMGIPAILDDDGYELVLMELKELGFLTFEEGFFGLTSEGHGMVIRLSDVSTCNLRAEPTTSLGQLLREKLGEGQYERPAPAKTTIAGEHGTTDGAILINESRMERIFVQVTERLLRAKESGSAVSGNKVLAIKMVRMAAVPRISLRQGKDFVDAVQAAITIADTPVHYQIYNCNLLA